MNHSEIVRSASIIDVRETMEFAMGHIQGATNIPLSVIQTKVGHLRSVQKPIVMYCKSGNRSGQAVRFLKAHGIQSVYNGGSQEDVERLLTETVA